MSTPSTPPTPNLDLDRGGNAMEGLYATNEQLRLVCEALQAHLTHAVTGTDAEKATAVAALVNVTQTARDQTVRVSQLTNQGRLRVTETLTPLMTKLPNYADNTLFTENDLPDRRNIRLPKPFEGGAGKTPDDNAVECRAFLAQMVDLSKANKLTELGTKRLIKLNVGKDLALIVGEMMEANATLEDIIRKIEVMYGGLKTPEQAQMECHKACRYPEENMMLLGRRIKQLAFMATRLKKKPEKARDELAKETLLAVISLELRQQLKALDDKKLALGQKKMDYETLVSEAKRLEDIRATELMVVRNRAANRGAVVRQVYNDPFNYDSKQFEAETQSNVESEAEVYMAQQDKRNYKKDKRTFKKRFPFANRRGRNIQGVRMLSDSDEEFGFSEDELTEMDQVGIEVIGEVMLMPAYNGNKKGYMKVSPKDLNVTPKQCLRCGLTGHRAFGASSKDCPLKNQPLVAKPCNLCGTGGHIPAACPKKK